MIAKDESLITVLGAGGGVGTELCLTLSEFPMIAVRAICRSEPEATMFRRCGIDYRIGQITSKVDAPRLLEDSHIIVDLTVPRGIPEAFRRATADIVENCLTLAPRFARYVYSSSVMAFGMSEPKDRHLRQHLFGKSLYGIKKRWAEGYIRAKASSLRREAFVFRLGQVHGEVQLCSLRLLKDLSHNDGGTYPVPRGNSNTLFVYTLAEALASISRGGARPGIYTLFSNPQWSWSELVQYYCSIHGFAVHVTEHTHPQQVTRGDLLAPTRRLAARLLSENRDALAGYLLPWFADFERKAKSQQLVRRAAIEGVDCNNFDNEVFRSAYWGTPDFQSFLTYFDRQTMFERTRSVRHRFKSALPRGLQVTPAEIN
jgi:nucleoside-diphosphate-sugar epimerase